MGPLRIDPSGVCCLVAPAMHFRILLPVPMLAAVALAQAPTCNDLSPFVAIAQQAFTQLQLPGLVLRLDQHGQTANLTTFGAHTVGQIMPIASGSKALAAAVLLSLVDANLCAFDDPVGNYLPEYATGPKAAITLRMCFSHTSGLPTFDPVTSDPTITLRQAAAQVALMPLHFPPDSAFEYGNVSMHVAGAVCEVVSGLPWHTLFQQRIAGPLGMTVTNFFTGGATQNPSIGDGAWSSAEDYTRFLDMLRQGGERNSVRVLAPASVELMLTDVIGNRPVVWSPNPFGVRCGLGMWLERQDALGRTLLACAPGAFGFFGWLDREHDATGVWLATTYFAWAYPYLRQCWDACDDALSPLGVDCLGLATPACAVPPRLNALTWSRDGQPDFGVQVLGAPASAFGGVWFALGPPGAGLPIFDLVAYVPLSSPLVPLITDPLGEGLYPFALPLGLFGLTCSMQGAWLNAGSCGTSGLIASRALRIDVLAP